MTLESTHPSLLDRLRNLNDQASWREFDAQYRELILRFCQRRGLQPADAEDVRQAVLMSLSGRLPAFVYRPEVGRFRDYLRATVRNAIWKQIRCQVPTPGELGEDIDDLPAPVAEEDLAWNEEWTLHHFRRAMERVRTQASPRSLAVFEGLVAGDTPAELAQAHGISVENVYKIKQRIKDRLHACVTQQLHDEEFAERRE